MLWIASHLKLGKHAKVLKLCTGLKIKRPQAIGHLHLFWYWCAENISDGELSEFSPEQLADVAEWKGNAGRFVDAMVTAGFLDLHGDKLVIHGWEEHIGKRQREIEASYLRTKAYRERHKNETPAAARAAEDHPQYGTRLKPANNRNETRINPAPNAYATPIAPVTNGVRNAEYSTVQKNTETETDRAKPAVIPTAPTAAAAPPDFKSKANGNGTPPKIYPGRVDGAAWDLIGACVRRVFDGEGDARRVIKAGINWVARPTERWQQIFIAACLHAAEQPECNDQAAYVIAMVGNVIQKKPGGWGVAGDRYLKAAAALLSEVGDERAKGPVDAEKQAWLDEAIGRTVKRVPAGGVA